MCWEKIPKYTAVCYQRKWKQQSCWCLVHRCHVKLVTPTFGHPGWLISQWNLKFWSPGAHIPRRLGTPGDWFTCENGHPLGNIVTPHKTDTATLIINITLSTCTVLANKLQRRANTAFTTFQQFFEHLATVCAMAIACCKYNFQCLTVESRI